MGRRLHLACHTCSAVFPTPTSTHTARGAQLVRSAWSTLREGAGVGGARCETSYAFPAGATHTADGAGNAVCRWEGFAVPDTPTLEPYCLYLSDGYIGFSWELGAV